MDPDVVSPTREKKTITRFMAITQVNASEQSGRCIECGNPTVNKCPVHNYIHNG